MPTRLCAEPRCGSPATYRGRCPLHARTNDQQINRAGHAIYRTRRWQLLRRHVLYEQPLCPGVLERTCGAIATDVHHIQDIDDGGEPWARSNLLGLCKHCHSRITRLSQHAR
jgi:5-methylcytosine-specific restriction protein A